MSEREDDLSETERRAFSELPRAASPGPGVEDAIVAALRGRGLIGRRRRLAVPLAAAAAGLALLALGYLLGRGFSANAGASPAAPRYALFLLRGEERLPTLAAEETARVAEYREWARGLARSGRFVTGEKLEDRAARLGASPPESASEPGEEIRGFFVISAADFQDALDVARGCPHLRHGGRILVRPIAPV